MGCSISSILFVAVFEIILIGAREVVRGLKSPSNDRLLLLRSYMNDDMSKMKIKSESL